MDILKAVEILKNDGVVGMPTETVYGLAADIKSPEGIDKIFQTKKRPFFDPLIVHIAHLVQIKSVVSNFHELAQFLAEKYWPGPLTMVLPRHKSLNKKITSGLENVGVRFPKHPIAQKLIITLNSPVAAPSANLFGKTSPTTAEHVVNEFSGAVSVLDGGPCEVGIESTVIGFNEHLTEVHIYRPGAITKKMIQEALNKEFVRQVIVMEAPSPAAPGQLQHHYMPKIPLILVPTQINIEDENFKNELKTKLKLPSVVYNEIKIAHDPVICAREIYEQLREASLSKATVLVIFTHDFMKDGIWDAIMDRLNKAASLKF